MAAFQTRHHDIAHYQSPCIINPRDKYLMTIICISLQLVPKMSQKRFEHENRHSFALKVLQRQSYHYFDTMDIIVIAESHATMQRDNVVRRPRRHFSLHQNENSPNLTNHFYG